MNDPTTDSGTDPASQPPVPPQYVALEKLDAAVSIEDVSSIIGLQGALKFNGGGHLNHSLFWENLCTKGSSTFPTSGPLKDAVDSRFGDFESMKKEMSAMCVGVQGSGWGWLGYDAKTGAFFVVL